MKISGTVRLGEAIHWAGRAIAPLTGGARGLIERYLIWAGLGFGGSALVIALIENGVLPQAAWEYGPSITFVLALVITIYISRHLLQRNVRRALLKRGFPDPEAVTIESGPEALHVKTATTDLRVAWSAVSDVLLLGPYWFVLAEGLPIYIPRRWFASPDEERTFLSALWDNLAPDSRRRSPKVTAFLGRPT